LSDFFGPITYLEIYFTLLNPSRSNIHIQIRTMTRVWRMRKMNGVWASYKALINWGSREKETNLVIRKRIFFS
jgi:hypothetical protein